MDDLGQRILRADGRHPKSTAGLMSTAARTTHDLQFAPWPVPIGSRTRSQAGYQPWYLANPVYRPEVMNQYEKVMPVRDLSEEKLAVPLVPGGQPRAGYVGSTIDFDRRGEMGEGCPCGMGRHGTRVQTGANSEGGILNSVGGVMGLLIMLLLIASVIISSILLCQLSHLAGSIMTMLKFVPMKS